MSRGHLLSRGYLLFRGHWERKVHRSSRGTGSQRIGCLQGDWDYRGILELGGFIVEKLEVQWYWESRVYWESRGIWELGEKGHRDCSKYME